MSNRAGPVTGRNDAYGRGTRLRGCGDCAGVPVLGLVGGIDRVSRLDLGAELLDAVPGADGGAVLRPRVVRRVVGQRAGSLQPFVRSSWATISPRDIN